MSIRFAFWGNVTLSTSTHPVDTFFLPTLPQGGFRGLSIVNNISPRTAPKFGTHVRIDTLTLKKIKMLTHHTPGGFRGLPIVKNLSRRTAPKFGTHARIDTLTLKIVLPTPPQGGLGGYILLKNLSPRTTPKHVQIHTLTLKK